MRVTWEPPEDQGYHVDGYRVTRLRQQLDPDAPIGERVFSWQKKSDKFVAPDQLWYDEKGLADNTTFRYKVTAFQYDAARRKVFGKQVGSVVCVAPLSGPVRCFFVLLPACIVTFLSMTVLACVCVVYNAWTNG